MSHEPGNTAANHTPLPVMLYGKPGCSGTAAIRLRLEELSIVFVEENIEDNERAAQYVELVNDGERLTPTIVFGDQDIVLVQPTAAEFDTARRRAGYQF